MHIETEQPHVDHGIDTVFGESTWGKRLLPLFMRTVDPGTIVSRRLDHGARRISGRTPLELDGTKTNVQVTISGGRDPEFVVEVIGEAPLTGPHDDLKTVVGGGYAGRVEVSVVGANTRPTYASWVLGFAADVVRPEANITS